VGGRGGGAGVEGMCEWGGGMGSSSSSNTRVMRALIWPEAKFCVFCTCIGGGGEGFWGWGDAVVSVAGRLLFVAAARLPAAVRTAPLFVMCGVWHLVSAMGGASAYVWGLWCAACMMRSVQDPQCDAPV
jgi:hypothetical protein